MHGSSLEQIVVNSVRPLFVGATGGGCGPDE
jgi:hypothetical protein